MSPLDYFVVKGSKVIETDFGWLNYFEYDTYYYLENIFVYPEFQNDGKGKELWHLFLKSIQPLKPIVGTINRAQIKDVEKNLMIFFSQGFKFHSSNDQTIFLKHAGK